MLALLLVGQSIAMEGSKFGDGLKESSFAGMFKKPQQKPEEIKKNETSIKEFAEQAHLSIFKYGLNKDLLIASASSFFASPLQDVVKRNENLLRYSDEKLLQVIKEIRKKNPNNKEWENVKTIGKALNIYDFLISRNDCQASSINFCFSNKLENLLAESRNNKILDVGCSFGFLAIFLESISFTSQYIGIDLNPRPEFYSLIKKDNLEARYNIMQKPIDFYQKLHSQNVVLEKYKLVLCLGSTILYPNNELHKNFAQNLKTVMNQDSELIVTGDGKKDQSFLFEALKDDFERIDTYIEQHTIYGINTPISFHHFRLRDK